MKWDELEKAAKAATPGPWIAAGPSFGGEFPVYCEEVLVDREHDDDGGYGICQAPTGLEKESTHDMSYIAAANPAAILELLSELHRLSAELDEVRADRDSWAQQASDRAGEAVAAIEELEALKKAISEAEPVAHIRKNGFRFLGEIEPQDDSETPLYTLKGIK